MLIDPRRLRFLLAIARTGGVLAAADELDVSPSAVSQQLGRLESEVGRPLVERTPRGVVLTEAGKALAEGAEEIERTLNLVRARLLRDEAGPTGVVRVGAFHSFLVAVLIPQLPTWRERFPGLRFDLIESHNDDLLRLLRTGELDVVVLEFDAGERSRTPSGQVTEVPLLDEPWKLVVPTGILQTADVVAIERITLPWLGVDTSAATESAVRRVRAATGRSDLTVHSYQEAQTAIALVAAGEGVALIPSLALRGVDRTGIDALDVPGLGTRRIVLRRHERRGVSEAVRAAASLVREAAAALASDDDISGRTS